MSDSTKTHQHLLWRVPPALPTNSPSSFASGESTEMDFVELGPWKASEAPGKQRPGRDEPRHSVLRNHSWRSGNHVGCWGSNPHRPHAKQAPCSLYYLSGYSQSWPPTVSPDSLGGWLSSRRRAWAAEENGECGQWCQPWPGSASLE